MAQVKWFWVLVHLVTGKQWVIVVWVIFLDV